MARNAKVLTAAAVRLHKPGAVRREVPDGGAVGLRLVIQPSGAMSWAMRFRRPSGVLAKLTLGTCDVAGEEITGEPAIGGHLTLAAARRLAAEVQRRRALGRDVVADQRNERQRTRAAAGERAGNTFGGGAIRFVEEHVRPKTRRWR
jgi:hypothetical protein